MWGADANVPASRSLCTRQCLTNAYKYTLPFFLKVKIKPLTLLQYVYLLKRYGIEFSRRTQIEKNNIEYKGTLAIASGDDNQNTSSVVH